MAALFVHLACQGLAICPSDPRHSRHLILLRSEIPSDICAKLRTVAASNNRDHACNLSYYCLLALHVWCYSSRTSRSWWITQSTQHHRRDATISPPFYNEPHRSHVLCVKAELRTTFTSWLQHHFVDVSLTLKHKHERWIWFTLSYAMMKALLRLAAVRDTKEAGELRGDTVHFIASSFARFFMMQNGSIYQPLKQTATCLLRLCSSKHIAENS